MGNVTITYTSLTTLVNDTTIAAATAEALIDQSINELNAWGLDLANLTGGGGAKTGTYASRYGGAIIDLAVALYMMYYKNAGASSSSDGIGGISESSSSSSGGAGSIHEAAHNLVRNLTGRSFQRT